MKLLLKFFLNELGFLKLNESFECEFCGEKNPLAKKTCRNHCKKCLVSKHLDKNFPGDRAANCGGKMIPISILGQFPDMKILHRCEKCGVTKKNKIALDDDFKSIIKISKKN